ncbi:thiamine phosphate synthase [Iodidimonas muriae]|uniref:Thiamine phosphate synthase n=1 Tax=Iodidimonas muriae TaxID=261467 RepID=A0ABQ2L9M2_9PROT|nr:thiamine phosphate synthase [Iodidimonas muriae]GGO07755.1 thiamine phosphate synthase [Iodidimonas muriae]
MKHIRPLVKRAPPCFFLADRGAGRDPLAILPHLRRGSGVVLRDYDAGDRAAFAQKMAHMTRMHGLFLLVAGDAALAQKTGAQGLHLPQWQLLRMGRTQVGRLRAICGPGAILTAAAHDRTALRHAAYLGVDAAFISPVFSTSSHPQAVSLGPHRLARLMEATNIPVYALGGLNSQTMRRLPPGLAGCAAISGFADPLSRRAFLGNF